MSTKTGTRQVITVIMLGLIAMAMGIATNGCGQRITSPVAVTADTTRPAVNSTNPANLATGVLLNRQITAAFSEALDPATITSATFALKQGTTPIAGAVSYAAAGAVATFDPASDLTASTVYTATLTTGIKDPDGNTLASNYVWSFTTGTTTDITPPTVSSTVPANLATGVALGGNIAVTFSEAMNPATITAVTFTLKQGTTVISGAVTSLGATATFNPSANLAASTVYTATITTGATDLAGNALVTAYVWTFTTGTTADVTPPTVVSTIPANADTGVAVNANIYVTFSEAMNPLTITASTITLKQGTTVISGAVTSPSTTTATFNPGSDLANNTVYTVTVTTGVKDLAGNAMVLAKVWSFTTIAAGTAGPPPVDLGTAGNFVLLSKTGISTTGSASVVGNMGVSPASATYITGFGLIMDVSNTFSTSSLVTGKVYASDYYPPTPANLTTAISDLETAYTDAAGRTNPTATELGAGNITSLTLVPGLYKWGTGVLVNAPGVTLTGGANDVWIFQIAQDLTIGSGAIITLSGGAQAKNIFWQVAGQVTLGTTANLKGIMLCQTLMSMETGSIFTGRALVQSAVTLDAATVTAP